ncbi:MAG: putative DNA-binding transcriptional regulator YafY [Rhodothermales bacterium]|jgi:predicted DNA-binding transcriptional regulator YafY
MSLEDRPARAPAQEAARRPNGSQLYRLTILKRWLIERRRWNATRAMKEFEVSRRTVMDDLEYLRMFGYDVVYQHNIKSFVLDEPGGDMVSLQLRESEWAAMVLAQEILEKLGAQRSAEAIKQIGERVRQLMPQLLGSEQSEFSPALAVVRGPSPDDPLPHYEPLAQAVKDQLTVRIRYYTLYRDKESERLVDPYRLVSRDGRGYLVGYCHKRDRVNIFRLDRIRELALTKDVFLVDNDFKLEDFLGPMFGMFTDHKTFPVKIRFSAFVANWIREEVWHKTQTMSDLPDGSVQVDMEVTGLVAVKKWVLSFGSDAEVLEPPNLRREIEYEVEKLGVMYQDKTQDGRA